MTILVSVLVFSFISFSQASSSTQQAHTTEIFNRGSHSASKMGENQSIFNPRMDYDEWTPLGRGDPLKNDPTYDYVPPVLDRVHYWIDPRKRTPDPPLPQSGVLVMSTRTEPSFTTRSSTSRLQPHIVKEADSRLDASSVLEPFFKLMDIPQFGGSDKFQKVPPGRIQRPHPQNNKQKVHQPQALQRPPYTMLMPPPPPPFKYQTSVVATTAAIPEATTPTLLATVPPASVPVASSNSTTINPNVLANTENVFKPVAISMPDQVNRVQNRTRENDLKYTTASVKTSTKGSSVTHPVGANFGRNPIKEVITRLEEPNRTKTSSNTATRNSIKDIDNAYTGTGGTGVTKEATTSIFPGQSKTQLKGIEATKNFLKTGQTRATTAPTTTSAVKVSALTTDPLLKQFRRPSESVRSPSFLIIQGHSKVKTYGASKNPINYLSTNNEISQDDGKNKRANIEKKSGRVYLDVDANVLVEDALDRVQGYTDYRRKRALYENSLRERNENEPEPEDQQDNLDLESLIAIGDDYDPQEVANILQREEQGQGSGFGDFPFSVFAKSKSSNSWPDEI